MARSFSSQLDSPSVCAALALIEMKGASTANVIAMVRASARPMVRDRICSPPRINHEETKGARFFFAFFVSSWLILIIFRASPIAAHCGMNDSSEVFESDC
jgi:hypothetical protein